jgi:predicted transcriptional regulator
MGITITPKKGCWIKFQLNLNNITYKRVAQEVDRSETLVSDFIKGRRNSPAVQTALCKVLGYPSFDKLIAASRGHIGGEA